MSDSGATALAMLRTLTGDPAADFRVGQLEAIRALASDRSRALLVQRTGWGKSAVYFIATRMLRDQGLGPTVIVSPFLALMRNQLEMADRLGLNAHTINSANRHDWDPIFAQIHAGEIDLLLISPERLNNPEFRSDVLPTLLGDIGLLVIDEVRCISDWGHAFRPDYRRLQQVVGSLAPNVPVLGTIATANDRVVEDVIEQLGESIELFRGSLERDSLALHVLHLRSQAERMAWLADNLPDLPGVGIVYCLTIKDAERVGDWLRSRGIDAATVENPVSLRYLPSDGVEHPPRVGEVLQCPPGLALGLGRAGLSGGRVKVRHQAEMAAGADATTGRPCMRTVMCSTLKLRSSPVPG